MKITLTPRMVHYQGRTLFFNASEHTMLLTEDLIVEEADICFVLPTHMIYISLSSTLAFYTRDLKTEALYGPYSDSLSILKYHMFGLYDNLAGFLKNSFSLNSELSCHEFMFNGFVYNTHTFEFNRKPARVLAEIQAHLSPIDSQFKFSFDYTTHISETVAEDFVNSLDAVFNKNHFENFLKVNKFGTMFSTDRSSSKGVTTAKGGAFFALNQSEKRHSVTYIPYVFIDGYIRFNNIDTDESRELFTKYISDASVEAISNERDMEYYKNRFSISITKKSIRLTKIDLFNEVLLVITTPNLLEQYILVRLGDSSIIPIRFNSFSKTYTILDQASVSRIPGLSVVNNHLEYKQIDLLIEDTDSSNTEVVISEELHFAVNHSKKQAYSKDNNVYSINYLDDILRYKIKGV